MSANLDTKIGFRQAWESTNLKELTPGGLHTGRVSPVQEGSDPNDPDRISEPYGVLFCEQGLEPNQHYARTSQAGRKYLDYRHVWVEVRGIGQEAIGEVVRRMREFFDFADFEIPNSDVKVIFPISEDDQLYQDEAMAHGEDRWIGRAGWQVMAARQVRPA